MELDPILRDRVPEDANASRAASPAVASAEPVMHEQQPVVEHEAVSGLAPQATEKQRVSTPMLAAAVIIALLVLVVLLLLMLSIMLITH